MASSKTGKFFQSFFDYCTFLNILSLSRESYPLVCAWEGKVPS